MEEEHRHCKMCGKVCDVDEEVCGKSCAAKREERLRSRRSVQWMLYGGMALLVILLIASEFRL
jgi:predicted nucleic acid-binding Zn ribbon protein